jgi:predicted dehydrogenase
MSLRAASLQRGFRMSNSANATAVAIVGAGYVADFYARTLPNHKGIRLAGVYDCDEARSARFGSHYSVPVFQSLDAVLRSQEIPIVVNLTNPRSHFGISQQCLQAGKHVYSEKPLAMTVEEAAILQQCAADNGVRLASAPCNHLCEAFQTLWKAVRGSLIGRVVLAYAEMDDGMVHRLRFRKWRNSLGVPWPGVDEFQVGCTFEHAGYQLVLLSALFGPARRVTSFASSQIPDKAPDLMAPTTAPDFSVGLVEYDAGVIARITCSTLACENRSLTVVGEDGWLRLKDVWDYYSPIHWGRWRLSAPELVIRRMMGTNITRRLRVPRRSRHWSKGHRMDFSSGLADFVSSLVTGTHSSVDADLGLHVVELVRLLNDTRGGGPRQVMSSIKERVPFP